MKLDMQSVFMQSRISLLASSRVLDYVLWSDCRDGKVMERLEKLGLDVDPADALALMLRNSGLVLKDVVYRLAFDNLDPDLKGDILKICPEAETDSQYLDQTETLAMFFDGKATLSEDEKNRIVDMICIPYTKYAKIFISRGLPQNDWMFHGYFADLPIIEVARKWASDAGISCEEHELAGKMREYAEKRSTDVQEIFKGALLKWLDEGLFADEYSGIWNSTGTATWGGVDTAIPHQDIFQKWMTAKAEAEKSIECMIREGKLKTESRNKTTFGVEEEVVVLSGESVYYLGEDIPFASDFKKQVSGMVPLASMVLFLKKRPFLKGYASLLAFAEVYKKISNIFEIDLGYAAAEYIELLGSDLDQADSELRYFAEKLEDANRIHHDTLVPTEVFVEDMLIRADEVKPEVCEAVESHLQEFRKIFGTGFG